MQPITPEMLKTLATACRRLISGKTEPARVAISYLHPRNAHPASLALYQALFAGASPLKLRLHAAASAASRLVLSAWRREKLWFGDPLPEAADVLIISHFVGDTQGTTGNDGYFGDLPARLATAGHRSVVAHINHGWAEARILQTGWKRLAAPRIILSRLIGTCAELSITRRLRRAARTVRADGHDTFSRSVARHAAAAATSNTSAVALRTGIQIEALVKALNPRLIVATFEGHAWERLAWHAARRVRSDIICVGYHHTVLFPHQQALATRLSGGYDPDIILTAGDVAADWFRDQPDWADTPVRALGSVRTPSGERREAPSTAPACLVVPEGLVSETLTLFRLAVACGRSAPDQPFILRLHPVLPKAEVLRAAPDLLDLPGNVRWSTHTLDDDLSASGTLLYRGSTVVITAVMNGLRPIYVTETPGETSIDPLIGLAFWRRNAASANELANILSADRAEPQSVRTADFRIAQDYCGRYFTPMNPGVLIDCLAEHGKHDH